MISNGQSGMSIMNIIVTKYYKVLYHLRSKKSWTIYTDHRVICIFGGPIASPHVALQDWLSRAVGWRCIMIS